MPLLDSHLVTASHDGRRRVVASADRAAQKLGLRPGLPLAQAQAMVPGLAVVEADPDGDAASLAELAGWCLRYAPLTSADPPDGVWIDVTGCAHLHEGEPALLEDLLARLGDKGMSARTAIADTPGAAHAVARYGGAAASVVPPGGHADALALLPIAALRLDAETVAVLRRLGLDLVGQLVSAPRAPLARRFGVRLLRRLDQALGRVAEAIVPVLPPETITHRLTFAEPLFTAEAFAAVIGHLAKAVCTALEHAGQGARRLDLLFERMDGTVQPVRVGTARPSRDPRHLGRLLDERVETVDPGLGVEAMRLVVSLAEPLAYAQDSASPLAGSPTAGTATVDLAPLVDRLVNRLGAGRVYRAAPVESDVPERSVRRVPALAPPLAVSWPVSLPRPARLLSPPQEVIAVAMLPDRPPARFTWRGVQHRVQRADGPERVFGEWWKRDGERRAVRDYWAVEDEQGTRFWLYRQGDGVDLATGGRRWFLHGLF